MPRLRANPGEILREEFFLPLRILARALAKRLEVPANRLINVICGARDVSADAAILLGSPYFSTDPRFWLNLQASFDLSKAQKKHNYRKSCHARRHEADRRILARHESDLSRLSATIIVKSVEHAFSSDWFEQKCRTGGNK
jgi:antitoxin HigA-1